MPRKPRQPLHTAQVLAYWAHCRIVLEGIFFSRYS
jgi:hypothetical protein